MAENTSPLEGRVEKAKLQIKGGEWIETVTVCCSVLGEGRL
jgi:hypothetical protein